MNKLLRILYKSFLWTIVNLLLVIALLYFVVQTDGVQQFITKQVISYLSKKINSKVSLKSAKFEFFNKIVLEDLYVEDKNKDTLLFINNFSAYINSFSFEKSEINLTKIIFNKLYGKISLNKDGVSNFQFIIDAFLKDTIKDSTVTNFKLNCSNFNLYSSRFDYYKFHEQLTENKNLINFNDISVSGLDVEVSNFKLINDSLQFNLKNTKFIEKSGFKINNLNSIIQLDSQKMNFEEFYCSINNSEIKLTNAALKYNSFEDFKLFNDKVKLDFSIDSINLNISDIGYFSSAMQNFDYNLSISGQIKGKVSDIRTKDLKIKFGEKSYLNGNIQLQGLPIIEDFFIIADISELRSNREDIEKIPLPPFDKQNFIKFPTNLQAINNIKYKGNFTGFLNDIVAYGELQTNIGTLITDISIKTDRLNDKINLDGKLKTRELNLSKLSNNNELLGNVNAVLKIKACQDNSKNKFSAIINGKITSLYFNYYTYNDIIVNGEIVDKKYDGAISIKDNNINLEFLGRVDFTNKVPEFDFTADVQQFNLYNTKFIKNDSLSNVSFLLSAGFKGDNIDNIIGEIKFYNLKVSNKIGSKSINSIVLSVDKDLESKKINLISDFIDIDIKGKYSFETFFNSIAEVSQKYMPSFITLSSKSNNKTSINEFEYFIKFKNSKDLLNMYFEKLKIADNTVLQGNFNSSNQSFQLTLKSDSIMFEGDKISKLNLNILTKNNILSTYLETNNLTFKNIDFNNFMINSEVYNDSIQLNTHWINDDSLKYSGDISLSAIFTLVENQKIPKLKLNIKPSNIVLADKVWSILPSKVFIDSTSIDIRDVVIKNEQQKIVFDGNISENIQDSLFIEFKNLNLNNINTLLRSDDIEFEGILNGNANVSNIYKNIVFKSDISVDSLVFNKEKLGNFFINSSWQNSTKAISFLAYTNRGNIKTFQVSGDYFPDRNYIDSKLIVDKLRLNIFEPFVDGILKDLRGIASGELKIVGDITKPNIVGDILFQKTAFTVEYLKTRYNFSNTVHVNNNSFEIKDVVLFDMHGNSSLVNGIVKHKNFKNFLLDVKLDAKNFCFLNTTEKDNNLYYGLAYASGLVTVYGSPSNINIDVNAKTEKNTKFFIPLSSSEVVNEIDFIKFVNKNKIVLENEDDYKVNLSGIKLKFDLEATPDAEVQIIFDSKVGDVIKAKGAGNISMEINTIGQFNMFGEYVIEQGDYLFTLQNIINKKFDIEKGSSIKWNGSAYDAFLNIKAIYKLKAPLYDLVLDTNDNYKKRVPIECILNMTNNIMTPNIKFDINLPFPDDKASNQISSLTEEELNKQILSLLVLSRFYTPDNLRGTATGEKYSGNAVGANSSELLSNQLSHWLSQISNDFDIGVNYRPGDEISSDELEVALSTQILNDRVNINGNVGVGGNKAASNSSGIVGDFSVDIKINKSGKLRVKGFTKSNENTLYESSSIQGIGLFYKEEFNTLGDLYRRYNFLLNIKGKH